MIECSANKLIGNLNLFLNKFAIYNATKAIDRCILFYTVACIPRSISIKNMQL